jgi:outer membrane protein assembly factor BamA
VTRAALTLGLLACLACKPTVAPTTSPTSPPGSPAASPTRHSLRGPVVAIEAVGTSRSAEAKSALGTTVGVTYEPAVVARDVRALWRLRGISDVQVDARIADGGVALRYRIVELPRVRKVELEGGPTVSAALWRIRLAEIKDVLQEPGTFKGLAEELRADLVSHAYLDATVDWRIVEAGEGRVDVILKVSEGPQVKLAALTLRGNKALSTAALTDLFRGHGVAIGQPFTQAAQDAARLGVLGRYQDLGHVNAEVVPASETRSVDGATISATYEIREGDAFRLGEFTVRGTRVAPVRDYEKRLGVRRGQPFNRSRVAQGLEDIRTMHKERGGQPNVLPNIEMDARTKKIDLTIEIGP